MGTNLKQSPIPVVPMTMKIVNPDGTPTRSGQLLLQQLSPANTIFGTHDTRPAPGDAPAGALYFETDRGVLYSNQNGNWQYVAGTMYATLSPDQRPTDLGQYDGGFQFVANDTDPAIRGRSFIWDGTEWIETTQVLYGTHSGRPAVADAPARCLYIEVDRSSVIYQNQGTAWQYVSGTMYGTITPDQRPTDLGTTDAGFDFRTNVDPARQFLWSGAAWIETTPIRYGTHAERLATVIADVVSGMFWTETDRGNVIYEAQGGVWLFLDGTMWGTLTPDQRPTDLGVNDDGFTFLATVTPLRSFIWASPSWVETTNVAGSSALIHPNVVTKVGAATGGIVEGGITDLSAANSGRLTITAPGLIDVAGSCRINGAVNPSGGVGVEIQYSAGGSIGYLFAYDRNAASAKNMHVGGDGTYGVHILAGSGNVGLGSTLSPTFQLQLSADSAGKPATSTWSVVSDLKLKQNIEPVKDDSLAILGKLDWIRYEYNGQASTPKGTKCIGLVAQELRAQLPEAVRSTKTKLNEADVDETEVLAIDYHHVIVHSARAIQQLNEELQKLRALIQKP